MLVMNQLMRMAEQCSFLYIKVILLQYLIISNITFILFRVNNLFRKVIALNSYLIIQRVKELTQDL